MAKDEVRKFEFSQLLKGRTETEIVRLEGGTTIHLPGCAFKATKPDVDDVEIDIDEGNISASADGIFFICPLQIPDKVIISEAIVTGSAAGETWALSRYDPSTGNTSTLASAAIGTADTIISDATIENARYTYFISTSSLDTNDALYGVKVQYKY